jgi:hypothetical protein
MRFEDLFTDEDESPDPGHPVVALFTAWDDSRPQEECLHCHGTGMADEYNECGFCFKEGDNK